MTDPAPTSENPAPGDTLPRTAGPAPTPDSDPSEVDGGLAGRRRELLASIRRVAAVNTALPALGAGLNAGLYGWRLIPIGALLTLQVLLAVHGARRVRSAGDRRRLDRLTRQLTTAFLLLGVLTVLAVVGLGVNALLAH